MLALAVKAYRANAHDLQKLTLAGPVEKLISTPAAGRGTRSSFGTAPPKLSATGPRVLN